MGKDSEGQGYKIPFIDYPRTTSHREPVIPDQSQDWRETEVIARRDPHQRSLMQVDVTDVSIMALVSILVLELIPTSRVHRPLIIPPGCTQIKTDRHCTAQRPQAPRSPHPALCGFCSWGRQEQCAVTAFAI